MIRQTAKVWPCLSKPLCCGVNRVIGSQGLKSQSIDYSFLGEVSSQLSDCEAVPYLADRLGILCVYSYSFYIFTLAVFLMIPVVENQALSVIQSGIVKVILTLNHRFTNTKECFEVSFMLAFEVC